MKVNLNEHAEPDISGADMSRVFLFLVNPASLVQKAYPSQDLYRVRLD